MTITYNVLIEEEDDWYVSDCPAIPGCLSQGRTLREAIENIKDAISGSISADDGKDPEDFKIRAFCVEFGEDMEGRWTASIPDLPGCSAVGDNGDEAYAALKVTLEKYLAVLSEDDDRLKATD